MRATSLQPRPHPAPPAEEPGRARPLRVLLLSGSLGIGGAERQLVTLARGLSAAGHHVSAAVFYGGGRFEEDLRAVGVPVHDLGRTSRWDLRFWPRLVALVSREQPDAVLAYLGGPNVFASTLKLVHPGLKVVWGIRSAMHETTESDWLARLSPRVMAAASVLADAVIANSHAARREAISAGIRGDKIVVIPNGIDCERFRPDPTGRTHTRCAWGLRDDTALVGIVARLDPVKSHGTFLRAAARVVARSDRDVRFVCIGTGDARWRAQLTRLADDLALSPRLTWAGELAATRSIYAALDVAVLSSDSESFPNTVAEAMACGVPVVVTDAGDTKIIVGGTGVVVPPGDPEALARGIAEAISGPSPAEERAARACRRDRIVREYSVPVLVARTERLVAQLLRGGAAEEP